MLDDIVTAVQRVMSRHTCNHWMLVQHACTCCKVHKIHQGKH